ncbi:hypothetical protein ACOSQ2_031790 [Xanthoceras sorbifolium]
MVLTRSMILVVCHVVGSGLSICLVFLDLGVGGSVSRILYRKRKRWALLTSLSVCRLINQEFRRFYLCIRTYSNVIHPIPADSQSLKFTSGQVLPPRRKGVLENSRRIGRVWSQCEDLRYKGRKLGVTQVQEVGQTRRGNFHI